MEVSSLTPWNAKEDALLAACVAQEGECNWMNVSQKMGIGRNWLSCCHRWTTFLKPKLNPGVKGTQEVKSQNLLPVFRSTPAQNDSRFLGKKNARDPTSLVYSEIYSRNLQSAKKVSRHLQTELPPSTGALAMGTPRPTLAATGTPRPTSAAMEIPRPTIASIGTLRRAVIQSENVLNSSSRELHLIQRMSALPEQISWPSVQDAMNVEPTGAEIFDPVLLAILEGLTSDGPLPDFWSP